MSCKDYPFVEKDKEKEHCSIRSYPNSRRVASDEAKNIILLFFYKGVDPTGQFYPYIERAAK